MTFHLSRRDISICDLHGAGDKYTLLETCGTHTNALELRCGVAPAAPIGKGHWAVKPCIQMTGE